MRPSNRTFDRSVRAGLIAIGLCFFVAGCSSENSLRTWGQVMESGGINDARARAECELWLGYSATEEPTWRIVAAEDSRIEEIREQAFQTGLDFSNDPNLSGTREGYAALCLASPRSSPSHRQFGYQLPDGQSGLLGEWTVESSGSVGSSVG